MGLTTVKGFTVDALRRILSNVPKEALIALITHMQQLQLSEIHANTQIIIAPGYNFKFVNGLITNFHQPQNTLLLLVAAFVGSDWKSIYQYAMDHHFRFLSYGDSSLLWRT
jgi:S-adenosylmethionine:tRNA ribosyltransferase-isomerase